MNFWDWMVIVACSGVILGIGYIGLLFALYIIIDVIDWLHYGRKD